MPWHKREFVVKDCDGRLLAFGANLSGFVGAGLQPGVVSQGFVGAGAFSLP
jgi:hypothetical protein